MGLPPQKGCRALSLPFRFIREHSDGSLSVSLELGGSDLQPPAVRMQPAQAGGQAPFWLWAAVVPAQCPFPWLPSPTSDPLLCPSRLDQSQQPAPLWRPQKDPVTQAGPEPKPKKFSIQ